MGIIRQASHESFIFVLEKLYSPLILENLVKKMSEKSLKDAPRFLLKELELRTIKERQEDLKLKIKKYIKKKEEVSKLYLEIKDKCKHSIEDIQYNEYYKTDTYGSNGTTRYAFYCKVCGKLILDCNSADDKW